MALSNDVLNFGHMDIEGDGIFHFGVAERCHRCKYGYWLDPAEFCLTRFDGCGHEGHDAFGRGLPLVNPALPTEKELFERLEWGTNQLKGSRSETPRDRAVEARAATTSPLPA